MKDLNLHRLTEPQRCYHYTNDRQEERLKYLEQDVKAQRQVYLQAAKAVWEQDKLNLCDFISMAQLANATASLDIKPDRLHKIPLEHEAPFREAYYGGRLVTTCIQWRSESYMDVELCDGNEEEYREIFENITDHVCYHDANSLYPAQMKKEKIACGPLTYYPIDEEESAVIIRMMKTESQQDEWGTWASRLVQVDVTCPTDLLVPFLMRRNEEGMNQQTLLPIEKRWYAGPELLEALLLGYTITRVHAYYHFRYFEPLYTSFITKQYALRKLHPVGALNILPKYKMNSASGKGGQKTKRQRTRILIGDQMYMVRPESSTEVKTIFQDAHCDEPLACFVESIQDVETTPFCLNATVWILAWSRVHMSRFMRAVGGYRDLLKCPLYGDTDSLFLRHEAIRKTPAHFFGKELGQFKNEMPDCRVIRMLVLAPKTYMKVFLATKYQRDGKCGDYYEKDGTLREVPRHSLLAHPEGRRVKNERGLPIPLEGHYEKMLQVTCKGIPHYSKPYRADSQYEVAGTKALEVLGTMERLIQRRMDKKRNDTGIFDHVHLRDRYHVYTEPNQPPRVFAAFTEETFANVLEKKGCFTTVFGVMNRNLTSTNLESIGIHLDYNHRKLSAVPYWDKGRRTRGECFMTYPLGYIPT